jgi:hypothetical protein
VLAIAAHALCRAVTGRLEGISADRVELAHGMIARWTISPAKRSDNSIVSGQFRRILHGRVAFNQLPPRHLWPSLRLQNLPIRRQNAGRP